MQNNYMLLDNHLSMAIGVLPTMARSLLMDQIFWGAGTGRMVYLRLLYARANGGRGSYTAWYGEGRVMEPKGISLRLSAFYKL